MHWNSGNDACQYTGTEVIFNNSIWFIDKDGNLKELSAKQNAIEEIKAQPFFKVKANE